MHDTVALALYSLICCFKDSYKPIIVQVLQCVGDAQAEQRIAQELFTILDDIGLECTVPQNRFRFKKAFGEFLNKLHSMVNI